MLDLMQTDNANAVRVCLITGLRIGDVLALKRDQIDEDGTIRTICAKTSKAFEGKIPVKLARDLMARGCGSEWLFPSPAPQCHGQHRTRQAVWHDLKRAAKRCASPRNVTPHTARKIYAVDTFKKNGLEEAQRVLQHDNLTTTLLYAFSDQLTQNKIAAAAPARTTEAPARTTEAAEEILSRFFESFGGREAFAEALERFVTG